MAGFNFSNVALVASLLPPVPYGPPAGTPYVTAPATTEETSPTRIPKNYSYYAQSNASGGQMGYTYSGAGSILYEEWFLGTGVTLKGYKHPDGRQFNIFIDGALAAVGNNNSTGPNGVEVIGQVLGLSFGYHRLTVYTNGNFSESDRNDFV